MNNLFDLKGKTAIVTGGSTGLGRGMSLGLAAAGADILVAHMGLTTKGTIGARTALTLDDCVKKVEAILKAGREVNPDIMVICHGGPIAEPGDAAYVIERTEGIDGFFGASSIERFAAERSIKAQTEEFKSIRK